MQLTYSAHFAYVLTVILKLVRHGIWKRVRINQLFSPGGGVGGWWGDRKKFENLCPGSYNHILMFILTTLSPHLSTVILASEIHVPFF